LNGHIDRLNAALQGRYTIQSELGSGGMATVYLAEDLKHHRKVALKVMRPELTAILGGERFLREIRIAAKLNHPHILALHDSGEADGFLFYVMPHVEGESLRAKLNREKQLSVDEAISITKQVGAALDYAHEQGVIHRDIKPENILIYQGEALVADFGIALAVSTAGGTRLTDTGLSLGTPQYMSPEQATGDRELDARSDVYSLGAILYEMLVGDPPHMGSTVQAIIAKVVSEEPRPVSTIRRSVPINVDAAVICALAKTPADRFGSGAEFVAALTNPAFSLPSTAGVAALVQHEGRWKSLAVAGVSAAVLFAAVALWGWLRTPPAADSGVARFQAPVADSRGWAGRRHRVAISPDGNRIAYIAVGQGSEDRLRVRQLDQLDTDAMEGTDGALDPFFSPDGRWVGFATITDLKKVPATGGPPVTVVDFPEPRGAVWTEEDVIYFGSTSGLWRVPASGGEAEQVTTLSAGELLHNRPQLLPDGRGLVFTVATGGVEDTQVAVYSWATGEITTLFPGLAPQYVASGHLVYGRTDGWLMGVAFDVDRMEVLDDPVTLVEGVLVKSTNTMDYALSRNGTLVYLAGVAGDVPRGGLVFVDRSGREYPVPGLSRGTAPRFSPDGTRIAVGVGDVPTRQVWGYDLADSTMTPLTFEGHNYYPIWSADGEYVVYSSETTDAVDLRLARSDGSGAWETLLSNGGWNYPGSWSADGRYLIYREQDPPTRDDIKSDIMILPLEGDRTPWRFLDLPTSREDAPALSPDGRWLAYDSDLSGQYEVYVNGFPDPGRRRKVSVDGGIGPVWSRDGRELFYCAGEALVVARVSTTGGFTVQDRTVLFEGYCGGWPYHAGYDVAPDGQRFVTGGQVEVPDVRLVVVLNWFTEMLEMVGSR
jgi:Tol biopolymer transport system component/tRNA A-37 threonylcarbamoyl transferase component Bud32